MNQPASIDELISVTYDQVFHHFENKNFDRIIEVTHKIVKLLQHQPATSMPSVEMTSLLVKNVLTLIPKIFESPSDIQDASDLEQTLERYSSNERRLDLYDALLTCLGTHRYPAKIYFIAAQIARDLGYHRAALRLTNDAYVLHPEDQSLRKLQRELQEDVAVSNRLLPILAESAPLKKLLQMSIFATLHQENIHQAQEWAELLLCAAPSDAKLSRFFIDISKRQMGRGRHISELPKGFLKEISAKPQQNVLESTPRIRLVENAGVIGAYGLVSLDGNHHITTYQGLGPDRAKVCGALFEEFTATSITHRTGHWLPLYDLYSENFWHWVVEGLPRVGAAEAAGFTGNYMLPRTDGFHIESMELMGVSPSRCFSLDCRSWRGDSVAVVEMPHYSDVPQVLSFVREQLLSQLSPNVERGGNRICIARRKRDFVNTEAVRECLESFGFDWVYLEDFPFRDQIALMSRATAVVGAHGAGMVHSLFAQKKSLIIECFSPNYFNPCLGPVIRYLKHQYHILPSQCVYDQPYQHKRLVDVPIHMLRVCLEIELERQERDQRQGKGD